MEHPVLSSQSQFLYARNPKTRHYGWEILITSRNGVIAPVIMA